MPFCFIALPFPPPLIPPVAKFLQTRIKRHSGAFGTEKNNRLPTERTGVPPTDVAEKYPPLPFWRAVATSNELSRPFIKGLRKGSTTWVPPSVGHDNKISIRIQLDGREEMHESPFFTVPNWGWEDGRMYCMLQVSGLSNWVKIIS
ncbi:hypothetical protein CDAR_570261 [Caerostris darwini]|uniref:Uncharacterized protein n=1 Tax=Caerostris darwini TaxID=1538125 RepID=A0AAV4PAM1_9ARAC|nr:hypothetical protein CDAR_570261 [Caerostris darwini]